MIVRTESYKCGVFTEFHRPGGVLMISFQQQKNTVKHSGDKYRVLEVYGSATVIVADEFRKHTIIPTAWH